jgi:hypothetical protein
MTERMPGGLRDIYGPRYGLRIVGPPIAEAQA